MSAATELRIARDNLDELIEDQFSVTRMSDYAVLLAEFETWVREDEKNQVAMKVGLGVLRGLGL